MAYEPSTSQAAGRRRRRAPAWLAVLVVVLATATACGDDAADDLDASAPTASATAAVPSAAPTATAAPSDPPDRSEDPSEPAPVDAPPGSLSADCRASVVAMLEGIEPYVEGRTMADINEDDDFDADGMANVVAEAEAQIEQACPPMEIRAAHEMMVDLARAEAPGTVWYLDMLLQVAGSHADG